MCGPDVIVFLFSGGQPFNMRGKKNSEKKIIKNFGETENFDEKKFEREKLRKNENFWRKYFYIQTKKAQLKFFSDKTLKEMDNFWREKFWKKKLWNNWKKNQV